MRHDHRVFRRLLICAPAIALLCTGVALLVIAPFAWGRAEIIDLPDAAPSVALLIMSTAPLIVGAAYLKSILNRTRDDFETSALQMVGGLLIFWVVIAGEVTVALRLTDPDFFDSLRDREGQPTMTVSGLIVQAVLGTLVIAAVLATGGYVIRQAITPILHRFDRPAEEPDAMGAILKGP